MASSTSLRLVEVTFPLKRQRFEQHKRLARWRLSLWLYVSITGVMVYLMLCGPHRS